MDNAICTHGYLNHAALESHFRSSLLYALTFPLFLAPIQAFVTVHDHGVIHGSLSEV